MQGCVAGEDTVYTPYKVSVFMVMYVRVKTIKGNETRAHQRVETAGDTYMEKRNLLIHTEGRDSGAASEKVAGKGPRRSLDSEGSAHWHSRGAALQ